MSTAKKKILTEDEIISIILDMIRGKTNSEETIDNKANYFIDLACVIGMLPNENEKDLERILNKTLQLNLTSFKEGSQSFLHIGDKGLEIFRQYGDYLSYKKSERKKEKKKERAESIDRNIRNGNIIVALLVSVFSVVVSQRPSAEKEEQTQLKEEVKHLSGQLDSLIQVARHDKTSKP